MSGLLNHRRRSIFEVFDWIAEHAPMSYGLLYVQDIEDKREDYHEGFRVFKLARGKMEEFADPFLSPRIPTIEDEYVF